jgi:hypothetical protein
MKTLAHLPLFVTLKTTVPQGLLSEDLNQQKFFFVELFKEISIMLQANYSENRMEISVATQKKSKICKNCFEKSLFSM